MSWYSDLPQVHAAGDGGPRDLTKVVVIHATDNTASAAAEASYATRREDGTSAHFYVDGTSVWQALDTSHVAYGCLFHGNSMSVQFELCGKSNQLSDATMRQAAPIVARVCREFGIPTTKIGKDQARAAWYSGGPGGICGHLDITYAFPEDGGDHTDPGTAFPWSTFMGYVTQGADDMYEDIDRRLSEKIYWMLLYLLENRSTLGGDGKHRPILTSRGEYAAAGNGVKQELDSIASRVDLNPDELAALGAQAAAGAKQGALDAADALADKLAAKLPGANRAEIVAALREVFADAGTP